MGGGVIEQAGEQKNMKGEYKMQKGQKT